MLGGGAIALLGGGGGGVTPTFGGNGAEMPRSVCCGRGSPLEAGFFDRLSKTSKSEPPWSLILGESPGQRL